MPKTSIRNKFNNKRLLEFCSREAELCNATYTYTYYKMHKIYLNYVTKWQMSLEKAKK